MKRSKDTETCTESLSQFLIPYGTENSEVRTVIQQCPLHELSEQWVEAIGQKKKIGT